MLFVVLRKPVAGLSRTNALLAQAEAHKTPIPPPAATIQTGLSGTQYVTSTFDPNDPTQTAVGAQKNISGISQAPASRIPSPPFKQKAPKSQLTLLRKYHQELIAIRRMLREAITQRTAESLRNGYVSRRVLNRITQLEVQEKNVIVRIRRLEDKYDFT